LPRKAIPSSVVHRCDLADCDILSLSWYSYDMPYQYKREPLTEAQAPRLANTCETPKERLVVWTLLVGDEPKGPRGKPRRDSSLNSDRGAADSGYGGLGRETVGPLNCFPGHPPLSSQLPLWGLLKSAAVRTDRKAWQPPSRPATWWCGT